MGLDTTHNAWHGSYSRFNSFRFWLAERIGLNLAEYAGYDNGTKDLKSINHPLMELFDHSDCDGELTPEQCQRIANGLTAVINATIPEEAPFSNYQKAIQFRDGCIAAFEANEVLEFK